MNASRPLRGSSGSVRATLVVVIVGFAGGFVAFVLLARSDLEVAARTSQGRVLGETTAHRFADTAERHEAIQLVAGEHRVELLSEPFTDGFDGPFDAPRSDDDFPGFHRHRPLPDVDQLISDLRFNPERRELPPAAREALSELIAEHNRYLAEAEERKLALVRDWADLRIAAGDFEYISSSGRHPRPSTRSISVTVSRRGVDLPMLVTIHPGENAALDVLSLDLESQVRDVILRVQQFFQ